MADDELDLDAIDPDESDNPQLVRQLRDAAKRRSKDLQQGQAAMRELAMLKAGVEVDSPVGRMFLKTYEGNLEDVATIKAGWEEVRPTSPPPAGEPPATGEPQGEVVPGSNPEGSTPPPPEDTGSEGRRALGGEGSAPGGAPPANTRQELLENSQRMMQNRDFETSAGKFLEGLRVGIVEGTIAPLPASGRREEA